MVVQAEHGQIIELRGASDKYLYVIFNSIQDFLRRPLFSAPQGFDHPVCAVELVAGIGCFRDTVRIDKQLGAGLQLHLVFPVSGHIYTAQDKAVSVLEKFKASPGLFQCGILMTGIGRHQFSCGYFQDAQPGCHEHSLGISRANLSVDSLQHF